MSPDAQGPFPRPLSASAEVDAWIEKAWDDVGVAWREYALGPGGSANAVCYHAQQAIEKMLKGNLQARGVQFPFSHDFVLLSTMLEKHEIRWKWPSEELAILTAYATNYRYPHLSAKRVDADHAIEVLKRAGIALGAIF